MKATFLVITSLLLFACSNKSQKTSTRNENVTVSSIVNDVKVTRDEQGIAHIDANDMKSAMRGLGYAQAQDRLFQMHFRRRSAQGRLSELFGSLDDAYLNEKLLKFDMKMRAMSYSSHNKKVFEQLSNERKLILRAFSEGVNHYLSELNGNLPSTFSRYDINIIEPWKPSDSLDAWSYLGNLFGGANIQIELNNYQDCKDGTCTAYQCGTAKPLDNPSAQVPEPDGGIMNWPPSYSFQNPATTLVKKIKFEIDRFKSRGIAQLVPEKSDLEFKASHAWAVRGTHTTTGKPLLSIDPKIPVYSSTFFYPFKLSINGFNIRGSGFAGTVAMLAFWNSHLGHAPTSSGGDFVDLLEIHTLDSNSYKIGDEVLTFSERRETILNKNGTSSTFTIKESDFGPILPAGMLNNQPVDKTYIIRHLEHLKTNSHSMFNIFDTMFAKSLPEYIEALDGYVFPSVNLVYAGLDQVNGPGDIAYFLGAGIPKRKNLIIDGRDLRGRYPIVVSTRDDIWREGLDLLEAPHVINPEKGYQVSANDLVVGDWYYRYAYPGAGGAGNSFRGFQVKEEIQDYMKDDGLISPNEMKQVQLSAKVETVKIFKDMLVQLFLNGDLGSNRITSNTIASTREEKAQKILFAFTTFLQEGGEHERGTRFNTLIEKFLAGNDSIVLKSRGGALSCRFNEAEAGVSRIMREFKDDNSLALDVEVKEFLLKVSSGIWDAMMSEGFDQNFENWPLYPEVEPYKVTQSIIFLCGQLGVPSSANVELCNRDQGVIEEVNLVRYFPNQINASSTSQFPSMVDFRNINQSVSFIPFGVSGEPESDRFGSNINKWVEISEGRIDAFPLAPLKTSSIPAADKEEYYLTFD